MSSLTLGDVMALSQQHPNLSLSTIQRFISLVSRLKDDILLAQPSSESVDESDPPDVLPPTIMTFLQTSCSISEDCVNSCWQVLKSTVWLHMKTEEDGMLDDFAKHGHSYGLCASLPYVIGVTLAYFCYQSSLPYIVSSPTGMCQSKLFTQPNWKIIEEGRAMSRGTIYS